MSRLGWSALLGACATAAALALGSRPLTVAGVGLLLAVALARAWAGAARGPVAVELDVSPAPVTDGERVRLRIEARRASRVPVGAITFRASLGRRGEIECGLSGRGRVARGEVDLGRLRRGRYEVEAARVELTDHLGLGTLATPVQARVAILVRPRLVTLGTLPGEHGRRGGDGRKVLLRRPVGFDFHSVREYEQGESLRRVHWPSTAKRGQLMVKELQDTPRDAVAVLLDCHPAGASPRATGESFEVAVRAAGSLVQALVGRGKRVLLVTTGREAQVVSARGLDGGLDTALEVLAAVEPDAPHGLEHALRRGRSAALEAGELVVVTASLDPSVPDELVRAAAFRPVTVVWIDGPSFAGRPTRPATGALRLAAAGIPTAVVRAGDDLATALAPPLGREAAHA